jgi:hypothetical protein
MLSRTLVMALILGLALTPLGIDRHGWPALSPALADDDGDDDGGGGGEGGGDGFSGSDRRATPRATRQAGPEVQLALPEIVVADLAPEVVDDLRAEGFSVIERVDLPAVPAVIWRLAPPADLPIEAARDRLRALPGGEAADVNHLYRPAQATADPPCTHANCAAHALVGWPGPAQRATCGAPLPIGVIDTAVNPDHDLLAGARLQVERLGDLPGEGSAAGHGTAVVSVLLGLAGSRVEGLLPEGEVLAVDVFSRLGGDERADTVALLRGLDRVAAAGLRVVNLSLSGPPNTALGAMIDRLAAGGMVLVASAGNGGPQAEPAFPAAHPGVIAVTAVDARGRPYRQAQRGEHLDLAAPGVGLMLATSISGARERSGTSFATPFVSAALALLLAQEPELGPQALRERLAGLARDAGAEGVDPVYGLGVLQVAGLCG